MTMSSRLVLVLALAAAMSGVRVGVRNDVLVLKAGESRVFAAEEEAARKAELVSVTGTVSVQPRPGGDGQVVKLVAAGGTTYNITMDRNGEAVARIFDGASVTVKGIVVEREGQQWLTIRGEREKAMERRGEGEGRALAEGAAREQAAREARARAEGGGRVEGRGEGEKRVEPRGEGEGRARPEGVAREQAAREARARAEREARARGEDVGRGEGERPREGGDAVKRAEPRGEGEGRARPEGEARARPEGEARAEGEGGLNLTAVSGTLSVRSKPGNEGPAIIGAKLIAADGTVYNVTMDKASQLLARRSEGANLTVRGLVEEKDGQKWLTIRKVMNSEGERRGEGERK